MHLSRGKMCCLILPPFPPEIKCILVSNISATRDVTINELELADLLDQIHIFHPGRNPWPTSAQLLKLHWNKYGSIEVVSDRLLHLLLYFGTSPLSSTAVIFTLTLKK